MNDLIFKESNVLRDSLAGSLLLIKDIKEKRNIFLTEKELKEEILDNYTIREDSYKFGLDVFPEYIMIGITYHKILTKSFGTALDSMVYDQNKELWRIPVFLDTNGVSNVIVKYDTSGQSSALVFIHNIMWSFLMELPALALCIDVYDNERRGQSIQPFLRLYKDVPSYFGDKLYTAKDSFKERLEQLNSLIDMRIQQKLGTNYSSIIQYNNDNPDRIEKIHLLVINDYPSGMDAATAALVTNIMKNGPKCGIYTVIGNNTDIAVSPYEKTNEALDKMKELSNYFWIKNGSCMNSSLDYVVTSDIVKWNTCVDDLVAREYFIIKKKNNNKSYSLCSITDKTPFGRASADALTIPVGVSADGKRSEIVFGKGSSNHALLVGATGSGKSTLLHTMIISSMLHYSPDELNLYLMDFKSGTEFKIYDTYKLPHIRLLALDAMQEFGVSILEELCAEMDNRADLFKEAGVSKFSEYKGSSDGKKMPRILVVMDEFQVLFNDSDKKNVAMDAASLTKKLVTQGRSYGIHLIMSTQTTSVIAESTTLSAGLIDQMRIRIGLKCSDNDCRYMFGDNADKASGMMSGTIGTAVYTQEYMEEPCSKFNVSFADDDIKRELLSIVEDEYFDVEQIKRTFEGKRTTSYIEYASAHPDDGESKFISIEPAEMIKVAPPLKITFNKASKHNTLICGADEKKADNLYNVLLLGALKAPTSQVYCVDGDMIIDEESFLPYYRQYERFGERFHLAEDNGDALRFIHELHDELMRRRKKKSDNTTFFFIRKLQTLELFSRLFANEDIDESEYTDEPVSSGAPAAEENNFFDFGVSAAPAGKGVTGMFSELLSSGNSYGIHFILSCTDYQVIDSCMKHYSGKAIDKFPERFIFRLNDSSAYDLIHDVNMSSLTENTVYYSNGLETSMVKPFVAPDPEMLKEYIDNGCTVSLPDTQTVSDRSSAPRERFSKLCVGKTEKRRCGRERFAKKYRHIAEMLKDWERYSDAENKYDMLRYYQAAADLGDTDAMCDLAYYYKRNSNETLASSWMHKAADRGSGRALYGISLWYDDRGKLFRDACVSLQYLEKACEVKYIRAIYRLGNRYYTGDAAVKKDPEKAFSLYKQAADYRHPLAEEKLGVMYFYGEGCDKDIELAAKYLVRLDKREHSIPLSSKAEYAFGVIYHLGKGVPQNLEKSIKLLERSGTADASYYLGNMLFRLEDQPRENYEKAEKYLDSAADRGHAGALYTLGLMYRDGISKYKAPDHKKAFEYFVAAADCGSDEAMCELADNYMARKNYTDAKAYFDKAAKLGNGYACRRMGELYRNGYGVPKDSKIAAQWYTKAADKGDPSGTYMLGILFNVGDGVDKNVDKARELLKKAFELGKHFAAANLGDIYFFEAKDYANAAEWYNKGAERSNSRSIYRLGYMYYDGIHFEQDYRKAAEMFEKVCDREDLALLFLGIMHKNGNYFAKNTDTAISYLKKAYDQGNKRSAGEIGDIYFEAKDYANAAEWYNKGAERSNALSIYRLGYMYYAGLHFKQDHRKAAEMFEKVCDLHPLASYYLGIMYSKGYYYDKNTDTAISYLKKAYDRGNIDAAGDIGDIYFHAKDYSNAAEWYNKGAERSDSHSIFGLGYMYYKGIHFEQDHRKAAEMFEKVCDREAEASYYLGLMYADGEYYTKNTDTAISYLKKSFDQGSKSAAGLIGRIYYDAEDYSRALEWYQISADNGNKVASYMLGTMYLFGEGVAEDQGQAAKFFERSAELGYGAAMTWIGAMYMNGLYYKQDNAMAEEWFKKALDAGDEDAKKFLEELSGK